MRNITPEKVASINAAKARAARVAAGRAQASAFEHGARLRRMRAASRWWERVLRIETWNRLVEKVRL